MTQSKTSSTPVSEETPWKDAVEEACIVNHLQIYPYDAKKTLANLINWEVLIALDPKVSKAAQDLFDAGAKSVVAPKLQNLQQELVAKLTRRAAFLRKCFGDNPATLACLAEELERQAKEIGDMDGR